MEQKEKENRIKKEWTAFHPQVCITTKSERNLGREETHLKNNVRIWSFGRIITTKYVW